jgi:hypothetical protein
VTSVPTKFRPWIHKSAAHRGRNVVLCVLTAPIMACGNGASNGRSAITTIDTLPGGRIIVHNAGPGRWDSAQAWKIVEEAVVTQNDSSAPPMKMIDNMEMGPGGQLYFNDRSNKTVHVFDSTGKFIRNIGRGGKGPGEFQYISGLFRDAQGRIVVIDDVLGRLTTFDSAGHVVSTRDVPMRYGGSLWGGVIDTDGRVIHAAVSQGTPLLHWLIQYDSLYHPIDSMSFPWILGQAFMWKSGGAAYAVPYSAHQIWQATPTHNVWIGMTNEYRIARINWKGDTTLIVERTDYESIPVTAHERDSCLEDLKPYIAKGVVVDPSRIPKVKPPLVMFTVDDRGFLWVEPYLATETGKVWDIFDQEGQYLGRIHSPVALLNTSWDRKPIIRGNRLFAVGSDADGNPAIVFARIVRP